MDVIDETGAERVVYAGLRKNCDQALFVAVTDEMRLSEVGLYSAWLVVVHGYMQERVVQAVWDKFHRRIYPSEVSRWSNKVRAALPYPGEPFVGLKSSFTAWFAERVEPAGMVEGPSGRMVAEAVSSQALRADYAGWAASKRPMAPEIDAVRFGRWMRETQADFAPRGNVSWYRGIRLKRAGLPDAVGVVTAPPPGPMIDRETGLPADPPPDEAPVSEQMAGRVEFALVPAPAAQMIDRETGRPIASSPALAPALTPAVAPGFAPTGLIVK